MENCRGGRTKSSQTTARALDYFDKFCSAETLESTLSLYKKLCDVIKVKPTNFPNFFPKLSSTLSSFDAQDVLSKYEKRAAQKCYENGHACEGTKVLIIGAGPCGLRTAIEAQLLGAKVVVIEKRESFSRNNVLHLWPFVITDLKALAGKKFYGKFCAGAIDHISISKLQFMLLKIALLVGVEVHFGVGFENVVKPKSSSGKGWTAIFSVENHPLCDYEFDVLVGADGRRNSLKGFKRKMLRGKLAIAITANFVNNRSAAEAKVQEISGVSFIFKQDFFNELCQCTGIDLENIVYYKDETHYFVMTAKKHSLLWKGVLYEDCADTDELLSPKNINSQKLEQYVMETVRFATDLPNLEFAKNYRQETDVALIDFTAMYAAENACRVVQRKGHKLLLGLVGDSLLEPFWPMGTGTARGFLSSLDLCWVLKSWSQKNKSAVEVIAERESIYRLLAQTTHENLAKDHAHYTVDPRTRYPHINLDTVKPFQVQNLFDSDEKQLEQEKEQQDPKSEQKAGADSRGGGGNTYASVKTNVNAKSIQKRGLVSTPNKKLTAAAPPTLPMQQKVGNSQAQPQQQKSQELPDVDKILGWYRENLTEHDLKIETVQDIFVQGYALCALINRFRPDLLEFPVPPEVQQGKDETEQAAFRNQLAFDFLKCEYSLPSLVSGLDATVNVSSNLSNLIQYASNVYEAFKYLKPQPPLTFSTTSTPSLGNSGNTTPTSPDSDTTSNASTGGYFSSVWTSSTSFVDGSLTQDTNSNDPPESYESPLRRSGSGLRRSSSIQRIVQRLDNNNNTNSSSPFPLRSQSQMNINNRAGQNNSRPPSFRFSSAPDDDDDDDDSDTDRMSASEVYINPYRTINHEIRRKRLEEAEKSKVETLKFVHMLQANKKAARDEERAAERERFIKLQRAQQMNEPIEETSMSNFKTMNNDDFFNEYNMRLWKQSRPSIGERTQNLETKLLGLERKPSFNELPLRQLQVPRTSGLMRSATEKIVQKPSTPLPSSVQKFRKDNNVVKTIQQKYAEGHGHVSLQTNLKEKKEETEKNITDKNNNGKQKEEKCEKPVEKSESPEKNKPAIQGKLAPSNHNNNNLTLTVGAAANSKTVQRAHTFAGKDSIKSSISCTAINKMANKNDSSKPAPAKKKPDFSEYFKAKDALKEKEEKARARAVERMNARLAEEARLKEAEEKKQQAMREYTRKVERERQQRMEEALKAEQLLKEKMTAANNAHKKPGQLSRNVSEESESDYEQCLSSPSPSTTTTTVTKRASPPSSSSSRDKNQRHSRSISSEFDELFEISEDDEELFANLSLKDEEVQHLLDWTEKTFT